MSILNNKMNKNTVKNNKPGLYVHNRFGLVYITEKTKVIIPIDIKLVTNKAKYLLFSRASGELF